MYTSVYSKAVATNQGRPRGHDEVRAAVVQAAARRFAGQGRRASLREIADDAGVNLGLIHRYIGNKEDLLRAVLEDATRRGASAVAAAPDPASAVGEIFAETAAGGLYVRTVAWLLLEDDGRLPPQERFPTVGHLRRLASAAGVGDERLMAALAVVYGWTLFGPQLLAAFDYRDRDRPEVERRLRALLEQVVQPSSQSTAPGGKGLTNREADGTLRRQSSTGERRGDRGTAHPDRRGRDRRG